MGIIYTKPIEPLLIDKYETFTPLITCNKSVATPPEVFYFHEFILQSLVRCWLSEDGNLQTLFSLCGLNSLQAEDFEVLGEKALPEGQIDLLIKDRTPAGYARKIIVEVKLGKVEGRDIVQLRNYIFKAGEECILGILIAGECSKTVRREAESQMIKCFTYRFGKIFTEERYSLEDLRSRFQIF